MELVLQLGLVDKVFIIISFNFRGFPFGFVEHVVEGLSVLLWRVDQFLNLVFVDEVELKSLVVRVEALFTDQLAFVLAVADCLVGLDLQLFEDVHYLFLLLLFALAPAEVFYDVDLGVQIQFVNF